MVIYKYEVEQGKVISAPFVKLLDIQEQGDKFVLWAIVEPNAPKLTSRVVFNILGTGWWFDKPPGKYVKTVQNFEGLVWHFFGDADDMRLLLEFGNPNMIDDKLNYAENKAYDNLDVNKDYNAMAALK